MQISPSHVGPCPSCGKDLKYIPEYDRYYCYSCNKYAPKGIEKQPAEKKPAEERSCPSCGKPLTYVEAYKRWYCYSCQKYAPREEAKPPEVVRRVPAVGGDTLAPASAPPGPS